MIVRSRLMERLLIRAPLVLLAAGAGFGKTTLLSAWVNHIPGHATRLTLDEQDNDPIHFWTSVLFALHTCLPLLGEEAYTLLHSLSGPPLPTILALLLNDLIQRGKEVTLILDDYQTIDEPAIAQTMGLPLAEEDVRELWQRTESWIAGLQLAALTLCRHLDPSSFVRHFSGSHRFIWDYVQQDILAHVSPSIHAFLLQTSVLMRLNTALCQAVTQAPDRQASQEMLEALERANLFVIPLDTERHWYRFHALFREALLMRLQAVEPEQVSLLHQRAARWYAGQGLLQEALAHAIEAGDWVLAVGLIERFVVPQSWRNEYHTLSRCLRRLPQEVLSSHPGLSFLAAQTIILTTPSGPSAWKSVQGPLNAAEQGYREAGNQVGLGSVLALRAVVTGFQGNFPHAFGLAKQALLLPPEEQQWRGQCLCVLGTEHILSGKPAQALPLLRQARALCDASGSLPGLQFATPLLGEASLMAGDLPQAVSFFQQVLGISTGQSDLAQVLLTDGAGESTYPL